MKFLLDDFQLKYTIAKLATEYGILYDIKLEWMSPEHFLELLRHPGGEAGIREESQKMIREGLKNGSKFPPLLYLRKHSIYEGRNRAHAAREFGIKEVPVLIVNEEKKKERESHWASAIQKIVDNSGGQKLVYQPIDHPFFNDWGLTQICTDRLEMIMKFLTSVVTRRVLDIGFFYGYFSHNLARRGATVVGVELSPKKVDVAKELSKCYGFPPTNPEFIHMPYQDYLKSDEQFDVTLFLSSFHHDLRETPEAAWEGMNLISQHTKILLLDMDEENTNKIWQTRYSMDWAPERILENSEFNIYKALGRSHHHKRMMYAFWKR